MAIARCCCLIAVVIILGVTDTEAATRRRRGHARLPVPTKETLPYVAEVLGAASFEETSDDAGGGPGSSPAGGRAGDSGVQEPVEQESKRVQRKLPPDSDSSSLDSVSYMEYQGVMGRPGVDFPVLASIPRTDFSCRSVKQAGYYADLHTGCQVFHICDGGRKISFLCPNGTIFRQSHLICDWWFRVDCGKSKEQYQESAELLAHDQMVYKKRAEEIAKAMQQGESKHDARLQLVELPTPTSVRPKSQARRKSGKVPLSSSTQPNKSGEFDKERQVPAETASFLGNQRHRFGGTLGETINRNAFSGEMKFSTTPSPSTFPVQSTTSKPVFTIRVKPNREFSFVELQKQDSKKISKEDRSVTFQPNPYPNVQFVRSKPVEVTTQYTYTHTPSPTRIQYSSTKPSKYNALSMNTKYSFSTGYSKNNLDYSLATTQLPPFLSQNRTNDIEFIRPEVINSLMETELTTSFPKFGTPTPASAVNTLHSLASYYESAAADVQKELNKDTDVHIKPPVSEILLRAHSGSPESGELEEKITTMLTTSKPEPTISYNDTVLPSVLTKATQVSYSYLFKNEQRQKLNTLNHVTPNVEISSENKDIDVKENIPERLVIDNTITEKEVPKKDDSREIQQQKESADLRELAQVFTRALSAYLEDPESFKEILAQVRPTEPNAVDTTTPSPEDEVLAFSDDNKNMNPKPHALPFTGTTSRPITPNDINNFIAAVTNIDADNSLEVSSSGSAVGSLEQQGTIRYFTTSAPTSIAHDINSIAVNSSLNNLASGEYYSSAQGSAEDNSYFPTAGGVTDGTRPRYGGFQNNTGDIIINNRKYSHYGSDIPPNITGAPLSDGPTTLHSLTTPFSVSTIQSTEEKLYQKIPEKLNLPDAFDVNNLATANFYGDPSVKFNNEETLYSNHKKVDPLLHREQDFYNSPGDQEKVLIASGTQSLFSANNYYSNYNGKENNAQKGANNIYPSIYSPFSYSNNLAQKPLDLSPKIENHKFSENLNIAPEDLKKSEDSTFPSTTLLGDYLSQEQTTYSPLFHPVKQDEDLINNGDAFTTSDPSFEQYTTLNYNLNSYDNQDKSPTEAQYHIQNVNLGNGVTLERTVKYTKPSAVTWSVPTPTDNIFDDWSDENKDVPPTTYHPQTKSEQAITTPNPFFIPSEPQLEQKAKEMFGNLNETATGKLMNMVDKAESNTTIRKLVLLLVNDENKENLTVEESRANLIQALLVNEGSDESTDNSKVNALDGSLNENYKSVSTGCGHENSNGMQHMAHSDRYNMKPCSNNEQVLTTQLPIETSSRMEFSVSSSSGPREGEKMSSKYRSGKNYRATDTQTAVVGSSLQTTELNNRLNSAKLFIPSTPDRKIPYNSDARAVELLKSLYNLAAKFG